MFSAEDQRLTTATGTEMETAPRSGGIPEPYAGEEVSQGSGPGAFGSGPGATRGPMSETASAPVSEPASEPAAGRGLPLLASVLIVDLVVALVALIVFVVIGVQRLDGATLDQRRAAYREDLVVFFVVGALFALAAYLLHRVGRAKVALVQVVVAVVALGLGGYAAVNGSPTTDLISPIVPDESPSPTAP